MDENIWKLAQIVMWLVGIQTAIIIAVITTMWASMNRKFDKVDQRFDKLEEKLTKKIDEGDSKLADGIDRLDDKLTDIDRRVCRIEGALQNKDCCMLKNEQHIKKVE